MDNVAYMDNAAQEGLAAASGAASITVEKHKNNFMKQHGTFEDKPSQNIVRWLSKATKYQHSHQIHSLEMASILINSIRGEPAIKVKRMLDVPGDNYINSDHFGPQPLQEPIPYQAYRERVAAVPHQQGVEFVAGIVAVQAVDAVDEILADDDHEAADAVEAIEAIEGVEQVDEVEHIEGAAEIQARPAILSVRHQPLVTADHCLRHYLTQLYQKRLNLSDATAFLNTFKKQKKKQTCSNYVDEFVIKYTNYAHLKWTVEHMEGVAFVQEIIADPEADPPVIGVAGVAHVPGNHALRAAEMIQLVTDGICEEFKIHCDNTQINLLQIDFTTLEEEVQNWQRYTTTGKAFTATCTPAHLGTKNVDCSALEMSDHFDVDIALELEEAQASSTQLSNPSGRGQRGGRGARGSGRGSRGRGSRGRNQQPRNSVQTKDSQDGGFFNYRQAQDGTLITSSVGHPLCNYCGRASHKREVCSVKKKDRAAGLTRNTHPDRDNPQAKATTPLPNRGITAEAYVASTTQHPQPTQYLSPSYPVPWTNHPPVMQTFQGAMNPWQQQPHPRPPNIQALVHSARMEHDQGVLNPLTAPTTAAAQPMTANPCPIQGCQTMFTDPYVAQEHMRNNHSQQTNLALLPGMNQ